MSRRYYSSRKGAGNLTLDQLYSKLQSSYILFRDKDYFKGNAGVTKYEGPDAIQCEAAIALTSQLFPIDECKRERIRF